MSETSDFVFTDTIPIAPLKVLALESCQEFADKVNKHILTFRKNDTEYLKQAKKELTYRGYDPATYLVKSQCPRFGTGEGKAIIEESIRGTDLFIMVDVMNHSLSYSVCGQKNYMSPDDHFQDLKRIISAAVASAHRVNVIMPFLYEGRQHKRTKRESLDCAVALEELAKMGVANIITFDAHDPRVQNAIPLNGFENFNPTYQFVKAILRKDPDLVIDDKFLVVISPDEGAMSRAVYLANNLGVDMGMFYKRRDYTKIVDGRNPIVAHEFLGSDVQGKTVIIIDDMISSGDSMLDTAMEFKSRKADRVIICCTFGLFTDGLDRFDEYNKMGAFDYVVTTNLNYRTPELLSRDWYLEADMSKFVAAIINTLNHDVSMSKIMDPTERIQSLIKEYNTKDKEFSQLNLEFDL